MNLLGVDIVSKISGFFIIILLAPFVILFGMGAKHLVPADWLILPPKPFVQIDWGLLITTIAWNTGGSSFFVTYVFSHHFEASHQRRSC
jgi:amino acid transporter